MKTYRDYEPISPALNVRFEFKEGMFSLLPALIGWKIVRVDTYRHQVNWVGSLDWKTTERNVFQYTIEYFLSHKTAKLALEILNRKYPTDCPVIPRHLDSVKDYLMDYQFNTSKLKRELRLVRNQQYYQR